MRETLLEILLEHLDPVAAMSWLDQPDEALGGRSPARVIIESGYNEVLTILRSDATFRYQSSD